jgi:hypothetical protein
VVGCVQLANYVHPRAMHIGFKEVLFKLESSSNLLAKYLKK